MGKKVKKDGSTSSLRLEGEIYIDRAVELRETVLKALDDSSKVDIDLSSVTGLDLSCLQLFCSACKTAQRRGKTLKISGIPTAIRQVLEEAGYVHYDVYTDDSEDICFDFGKDVE